MDTYSAMLLGMMNRGRTSRVFDWNKAAEIINEKHILNADAGLQNDMEWTAGEILRDGKPVTNSYTFLASVWAIPVLSYYKSEEDEYPTEIPCYVMADETTFDAHTKWPQSALDILEHKSSLA